MFMYCWRVKSSSENCTAHEKCNLLDVMSKSIEVGLDRIS